MDVALWCYKNDKSIMELADDLSVTLEVAEHVYKDIENKRKMTKYLASQPAKI
jgi:hypothetical protein